MNFANLSTSTGFSPLGFLGGLFGQRRQNIANASDLKKAAEQLSRRTKLKRK